MLLAKEVLEGQELRSQLMQVQAPTAIDEWLKTGKLPANDLSIPYLNNGLWLTAHGS
jgi:cell division protease FtsH